MSDLYKEYRRLKDAKENKCRDQVGRRTEQSKDTPEVTTATKVLKKINKILLVCFYLKLPIFAGTRMLGGPSKPKCTAHTTSQVDSPGERESQSLCTILWAKA